MVITPIKTRKFIPPKDDLRDLLSAVTFIEENSIVVVTSKVVAISQGRTIPTFDCPDRDELAKKEADLYLPRKMVPGGYFLYTIKNSLLIASAGIDKSNGGDYYILWPENSKREAKKIWTYLRKKFGVKNLGIIITDSHAVPMHRGLVGMSLGYWGFMPLRDYRGENDIFGNKLKVSQTNVPDSLASAAVFVMGEGKEQTPLAIITDLPKSIVFVEEETKPKREFSDYGVEMKDDLYNPFFSSVPWKKGGGGI